MSYFDCSLKQKQWDEEDSIHVFYCFHQMHSMTRKWCLTYVFVAIVAQMAIIFAVDINDAIYCLCMTKKKQNSRTMPLHIIIKITFYICMTVVITWFCILIHFILGDFSNSHIFFTLEQFWYCYPKMHIHPTLG